MDFAFRWKIVSTQQINVLYKLNIKKVENMPEYGKIKKLNDSPVPIQCKEDI